MSRLVGTLLALVVGLAAITPLPARALPLDGGHLVAIQRLAEPISECISRRDTESPAFHGCYDWHSAVHANLAVRIIARLTGDAEYATRADQIASGSALAAEHQRLESGLLAEELPYGYAWLLLLDREARRPDVRDMARDAAAEVRAWLSTRLDQPFHVAGTRYGSSTFAAYALHAWYASVAPERASRFAEAAVPRLLAQRELACGDDALRPGFLDPCAQMLLALSQMASDVAVDRDILAEMAGTVAARPAVRAADMRAIFEAGLNFSRAWALYAAAGVTGDDALVRRADQLFDVQMGQPEMWREGYDDYSHWVAQFGIYALSLRTELGPGGTAPAPIELPPIPLPEPPPIPLPPQPEPLPPETPEAPDGVGAGPWLVAPWVWAY